MSDRPLPIHLLGPERPNARHEMTECSLWTQGIEDRVTDVLDDVTCLSCLHLFEKRLAKAD